MKATLRYWRKLKQKGNLNLTKEEADEISRARNEEVGFGNLIFTVRKRD